MVPVSGRVATFYVELSGSGGPGGWHVGERSRTRLGLLPCLGATRASGHADSTDMHATVASCESCAAEMPREVSQRAYMILSTTLSVPALPHCVAHPLHTLRPRLALPLPRLEQHKPPRHTSPPCSLTRSLLGPNLAEEYQSAQMHVTRVSNVIVAEVTWLR